MQVSFTDKLLLREVSCLFLLQSEDEHGEQVFAYIAVDGGDLETFRQMLGRPLFNPAQLGDVLLSGRGAPSEAQKRHMEATYGFNHEAMQPLT